MPEFGPAILKTAGFGYDGKGQYRVRTLTEAEKSWEAMGGQEAVLEAVVDFEAELSVVGVRSADGECAFFEPFCNTHVNGILDVTTSPAPFDRAITRKAHELARARAGGAECDGRAVRRVFP